MAMTTGLEVFNLLQPGHLGFAESDEDFVRTACATGPKPNDPNRGWGNCDLNPHPEHFGVVTVFVTNHRGSRAALRAIQKCSLDPVAKTPSNENKSTPRNTHRHEYRQSNTRPNTE